MSDFQCKQCEKFILPDLSRLAVGDDVSFTESSSTRAGTVRFQNKTGTITAVRHDLLQVKVKRGGTYLLKRNEVFPAEAPSQLTYAQLGTCECKPADGTGQSRYPAEVVESEGGEA